MNLSKIPPELKARPQWVVWQVETREGKETKVPYQPRNPKRRASSTNPANWGTLEQALSVVTINGFAGIGYVFSPQDDFAGVDLDKCRDPVTEKIEPWAMANIDRLASYTEISPSGRGLHILVKGKVPTGGNKKDKVEMYSQARYFTMTGYHLEGATTTIEPRQAQLEALHTEIFGKPSEQNHLPPKTPGAALEMTDFALIDRAKSASNGHKFSQLWGGDTSAYPSPSEATAALCSMLAYWTQKDPGRMDRLFRQSGLMRDKWDRPQSGSTWGALEIQKAIDKTTEVYTPPQAQERPQDKPQVAPKSSPQTGKPQKPTLKPFTARELGDKDFPEPRWAIPDLIPEGLTILGGRPKIGKSWFALNLAVAAATGGVALGKIQVEQGECLYLALEDTPRRLKERLGKIIPFGDLPDTLHFITAADFPRLFKDGLDALSAWLTEHPQARLMILDTLARIKPPRGNNADPYEHDSQVMSALQGLAALHQIALIVVAHTKKGKEDDFLSNILGSSGQTGVADCVAELTRKARGQMGGTLKLTGRDIQENELPMRFVPDLGMWELLEGEPKDYEMSKERQDILLILREVGPKKPAQLAKLLDKSRDSVKMILSRMKDSGLVKVNSQGEYETL